MFRVQCDETPAERELAPVAHSINIAVCTAILKTEKIIDQLTLPQKLTSLVSSKRPLGGGNANWKWALTTVIVLISSVNVEKRILVLKFQASWPGSVVLLLFLYLPTRVGA
jgi:hypothetical protein